MTNVLVFAAVRPDTQSMLHAATKLRRAGARVRLACGFDPRDMPQGDLDEVHELAMDLGRWRGKRPRKYTPLWTVTVIRNRIVRARAARAKPNKRVLLLCRRDPWVEMQTREADVLVAFDDLAALTVTQLARTGGGLPALQSVHKLLAGLEGLRLFTGVASVNSLRSRSAADVLEAWKLAELTVGREGRRSLLRSSPRVVRALRRSKAFEEAEALARLALGLRPGPEVTSWLRLELTATQISMLAKPDHPLDTVVERAMAVTDAELHRGNLAEAVDLAISATETILHRELHAEVESSPLTENPRSFLAALQGSLTYRALGAPAGSLREEIRTQVGTTQTTAVARTSVFTPPAASDRPRRVLVISGGNMHFAEVILSDLEQAAVAEVRQLDLRGCRERFGRQDLPTMMIDKIAESSGQPPPRLELAPEDAELLIWPDRVFIDWCDNAAMWALLHMPRHIHVVVRIHSVEALSHQPHMMDWSRVDDVIFVGPHVRDFLVQAVPSLERAGRIHVLPNATRLERFGRSKTTQANRTIAMIGWGQQVKDPLSTVELLAKLRIHDARWRLLLIGRDFAESQTVSGARYRDQFRQRAAADDVRNAIVNVGYTEDLPEALRDVGFVINTSRREGNSVGLVEGAASGAVPVVRNWPLYARYGGAYAVYPSDWVVDSMDAAAQRILERSEASARRASGAEARVCALERFDWPVVAPRYRDVLLGQVAETHSSKVALPPSPHRGITTVKPCPPT